VLAALPLFLKGVEMKLRIFLAVILVVAAAVAGRHMNRQPEVEAAAGRQKIHERYVLIPGTQVTVRGINGSVEVKTAETDTAEVNVVSTSSGGGFNNRGIIVEHTSDELVIRGERGNDGFWRWLSGEGKVRHQVSLVLPRRVEFEAKGINGPLTIGEIEGSVSLSGVNGRVEVAGPAGHFRASGVNGSVKVAIARLGDDGMEVRGVNGNVEVRVPAGLDADVEVRGHNGSLSLDVPNVTSHERTGRSKARARIGAGGPAIEFSGINGSVRLVSAAGAAPVAAGVAQAGGGPAALPPPAPPAPPANAAPPALPVP
jgi:HSP20 family molecular chaperone IbpA